MFFNEYDHHRDNEPLCVRISDNTDSPSPDDADFLFEADAETFVDALLA
jgi:hypothetical protein